MGRPERVVHPLNLHRLRIFYAVAQRRSISAAADDLMLSQPAVSLQLKALERELGLPLFQRGGPALTPTQAGEVLYRSAVSILNAEEEVERAIAELRGASKGRLILGAGTTGGMYVLPRIVQAYKRLRPDTEIVFQVGTTEQLLDRLVQNIVDVLVVGGHIDDRRFASEPLCTDELVLIAAPTHPLAARSTVALHDLGKVPFIVPETGSWTRQLVERTLREAGVPLRIAMQLPGTEGVKRGVEAGLGVGIVTSFSVEAELATGVLKRLAVQDWKLTRPMSLVYRAQKYFSPAGRQFLEFAKSYGTMNLEPHPDRVNGTQVDGPLGAPATSRGGGSRAREVRREGTTAAAANSVESRRGGMGDAS